MDAFDLETMRQCYRRYVAGGPLEQQAETIVLDVGASDAEGTYHAIFDQPPFRYVIADPAPVPGTGGAPGSLYRIPQADAWADIVVASGALEHGDFIWHLCKEMVRVLRPNGFIFLILPSAGLIHRYPVDRYRFFPDACEALAQYAGCTLLDRWQSDGPWRDHVGVFRRADAPPLQSAPSTPIAEPPDLSGRLGTREEETTAGAISYLKILERLHAALSPSHYLEIGVRLGVSLALARGPATGVDPDPELESAPPQTTRVLRLTSDTFFADHTAGMAPPDLCFIDGMHLFEYALRDFMNIERCAAPGAVVVIDDVFPNHPRQAERERSTRAWTGDVWRVVEALRHRRPDLFLLPIDTSPTGLLLVAGLDPANRILWDGYASVLREARAQTVLPHSVLAREGAVSPTSALLDRVIETLKAVRAASCKPQDIVTRLRRAAAPDATPSPPPRIELPKVALPRTNAPKLSLILIGYNMPRELPRTIRSLSPAMQRGIDPQDYEVILLDNGSTPPADAAQLQALLPGLVAYRMANASVSPVPAINFGLSVASGDLIGVCIDGARMASPGLLSKALAASRLYERPVIGTVAFHLGPSVQDESMRHDYNEAAEDALLAGSGWEADGYRLFGIASLATSSAGGWFALPSESNAFFLRAEHWRALGGWDKGFTTPGGGLANADTWARACADSTAEVIMLLGEATFRQIHGDVATDNANSAIALFEDEYRRLRGHAYQVPTREPLFFGPLPDGLRGSAILQNERR